MQKQAQENALEERRQAHEMQMKEKELQMQMEFDKWKAELDARTKIEVAEIAAGAALDSAEIKSANAGVEGDASGAEGKKPQGRLTTSLDSLAKMHGEGMTKMTESHGKLAESISSLAQAHSAKKKTKILRDAGGRVIGAESA